MNANQRNAIGLMNDLGAKGIPFAFIIDFDFEKPLICRLEDASSMLWQTPGGRNFMPREQTRELLQWKIRPVEFQHYRKAFSKVQEHIHRGDTYLLNLTMPTEVETNLSLEELFHLSKAPYKIWLKDQFVCFSPEIFVRIQDGIISSYPMKGTIDASVEDAAQRLLNDQKEVAEHHTIVDLIRNDLSRIANDIKVDRLMYLDKIHTNEGDLLQMSSTISGVLPENYQPSIGSLIAQLLPAGSICGAPKPKTVEIIKSSETVKRGYYTGIFGVFDGKNLDSCVLIRYLEQQGGQLVFKSGGGITFLSDCASEYEELIRKVYVPID